LVQEVVADYRVEVETHPNSMPPANQQKGHSSTAAADFDEVHCAAGFWYVPVAQEGGHVAIPEEVLVEVRLAVQVRAKEPVRWPNIFLQTCQEELQVVVTVPGVVELFYCLTAPQALVKERLLPQEGEGKERLQAFSTVVVAWFAPFDARLPDDGFACLPQELLLGLLLHPGFCREG